MADDLPVFDNEWNYSDPEGTERVFRGYLLAARTLQNHTYLAELLTQIARTEGLQGRFDDAHGTLDEVDVLLPRASGRAHIRSLLERGRVYNSAGRPDEARPLFTRAWAMALEAGEDFYAIDAAHMVAIVEPPEEQLAWAERAINLARGSADARAQGWLGSLYNNTGWTYHTLGRYVEALATFEKGLEWQEAAGNGARARIAAWTVARALRSLGRYEDALHMQGQNQRRLDEAGETSGYVQEEIAECLLALGRAKEARPHFARAHALLSADSRLRAHEASRLDRLAGLGEVQ